MRPYRLAVAAIIALSTAAACGSDPPEGDDRSGQSCAACDGGSAEAASADASATDAAAGADARHDGASAPSDGGLDASDASLDASDAGTGASCLTQLGDRGVDSVAIAVGDAAGAIVFAGTFRGTMDLGGGIVMQSEGDSDEKFMAKLDRNCRAVFARPIGRDYPLLAVTSAGDIYALAEPTAQLRATSAPDRVDFGLGPPSVLGPLLVKLSPLGVALWQETVIVPAGSSVVEAGANSLSTTPAGGVVLAGDYYGVGVGDTIAIAGHTLPAPASPRYGAFVAAFDANGAFLTNVVLPAFTPTLGLGGTHAAVDASGNVFVSGKCAATDSLALPGGAQPCPGSGFLAKIDPTFASTTWLRADAGYSEITVSAVGDIYLLGAHGKTLTKLPDAAVGTAWTKSLPTNAVLTSIAVGPGGRVFAGADLYAASDLGGGTLTPFTNDSYLPQVGSFVVSYANDGSYESATGYRNVQLAKVLVDPIAGDLVVVGEFIDRADLGTGVLTPKYYAAPDIVVARAPSRSPADPGTRPSPVGGVPEVVLAAYDGQAVYATPTTVFLKQSFTGDIQQCAAGGCAAGLTNVFHPPSGAAEYLAWSADAFLGATGGDSFSGPAAITCAWTSGTCVAPRPDFHLFGLFVDPSSIFWLESPQMITTTQHLMKRPRDGSSAAVEISDGLASPTVPIVSDGTSLVFAVRDPSEPNAAALVTCPAAGCAGAFTTLASGLGAVTQPMSTGSTFVFGDGSAILRCETTGCAGRPSVLAAGWPAVGPPLVDATGIYFLEGRAQGPAAIVTCPLAGCPATGPTVLAAGQAVKSVAMDATHVYWLTTDNKLLRIAK